MPDDQDMNLQELLNGYLDGELDEDGAAELHKTLESSPEIKHKLAILAVVERLLRASRIPPASVEKIMGTLPKAEPGKGDQLRGGEAEVPDKKKRLVFRSGKERKKQIRERKKKAWNTARTSHDRGLPLAIIAVMMACLLIAGGVVWKTTKRMPISDFRMPNEDVKSVTDDVSPFPRPVSQPLTTNNQQLATGRRVSTRAVEIGIQQVMYNGGSCARSNQLAVLLRTFNTRTDVRVKKGGEGTRLAAVDVFNAPVLYMSGHDRFSFSEDERKNLLRYIRSGGFLFAESCCGGEDFDNSFRAEMKKIFKKQQLAVIPAGDIIYRVPNEVTQMTVTPSLAEKLGSAVQPPVLEGIRMGENYVVVYSRYGLAGSWAGIQDPGKAAYNDVRSLHLAQNILMYAITH